MLKWIQDNYAQTKDAVLVAKHFEYQLEVKLTQFLVKGREQELLELAKQLEEEEKKKIERNQ